MTATEINEELALIKKAREAIYKTGVSFSRNGIQITRASLPALNDRERILRASLKRQTTGACALSDFRNA